MQVESTDRHPYHTQRLLDYRIKSRHPSGRRDIRLRETLLFMGTDEETVRRAHLFPLNPQLDGKVEVDEEGNLYYSKWVLAGVVEDPNILGQQLPPGKTDQDYYEDPPDKTPRKLVFPLIPQGMEQMLRVADHILESEREELTFLSTAYGWLRVLRRFSAYYSEMTTQDALNLRQQGIELAIKLGSKLKDPHKKKIAEMVSKGVSIVDEEGNVRVEKNFIAGFSRGFGIELRALKRRAAVHAAIDKYTIISKEVGLERDHTREHLEGVVADLDRLLTEPIFADPSLTGRPRGEWIGQVSAAANLLTSISSVFSIHVIVRPYILGTRKAIEHWGIPQTLPHATKAEELQIKRAGKRTQALRQVEQTEADKYDTVMDFLNESRFQQARQLIELVRDKIFRAMLDKNRDISVKQGNHGGQVPTVEIDGWLVRQAREMQGLQPEDMTIPISPYYLSKIESSSRIRVASQLARWLAKRLDIPRKDLVLPKPQEPVVSLDSHLVRQLRRSANMTRVDLAHQMGENVRYYNRILRQIEAKDRDSFEVPESLAQRLARGLGLENIDLLLIN